MKERKKNDKKQKKIIWKRSENVSVLGVFFQKYPVSLSPTIRFRRVCLSSYAKITWKWCLSLLILWNGRRAVNRAPLIAIRGSRSANRTQVFNLFLLPYNTKLGMLSKPWIIKIGTSTYIYARKTAKQV